MKSRWNLTTRTRGTARKRNGTPGLVARTYLTDIVPTSRGLRARRRCASPRRLRRGFRIFSGKAAFSREFEKGGCVDREETAARTVVGTRHGQATASAARRTETGAARLRTLLRADTWGSTLGRTRTTSTSLAEARASPPTRVLPSSNARRDEDASRYARTGAFALLPPYRTHRRHARARFPHLSLTSVPAMTPNAVLERGVPRGRGGG